MARLTHLQPMATYGIGATALLPARGFCPDGRLFIKREASNMGGSIKARTAYYILQDLCQRVGELAGRTLIESTSGNLGIALARLGNDLGLRVICAVDPTVAQEKLALIEAAGGEICVVDPGGCPDFRAARIAHVKRIADELGHLWPNQYANEAGMRAHADTTGPEIWADTAGQVDMVVSAVGTGGTICGLGQFFRKTGRPVSIVGVEPVGSTIFGGSPGPYLSSGSGLDGPSVLVQQHGSLIDFFAKVPDSAAITACLEFSNCEDFDVGLTGIAAALVGRQLARRYPDKLVVAVAADGADNYRSVLVGTSVGGLIDTPQSLALEPPPWTCELNPT